MNAILYLQNSLEFLVKHQLDRISNEDDVVQCVQNSVKNVCLHHNLQVDDELITRFLRLLEDDPCTRFEWRQTKGFETFESNFVYYNLLHYEAHSDNARMQICELEEYSPTTEIQCERNVPLGVVLLETSESKVSLASLHYNGNDLELKTLLTFQDQDRTVLTSVPDSKSNIVFIATHSGRCTVGQVINDKFKILVEFLLDVPEQGRLDSIACKRCAKEGDLILFWEGINSNPQERWKFHTGINESALKTEKLDRLFRSVSEEEISSITYTKPQISTFVNVVFDEHKTPLFVSNALVASDCCSMKNKRHALLVLTPVFSFATKCSRLEQSKCLCGVQYFFKGKCGRVQESEGVHVHSITMF